jgi:predicted nuclease of predicted toxin-antitoxin system
VKFKLDENFGARTQRLFVETGHDVHTVHEETLAGATDQQIYERCCAEIRCLVTLDLDFADVVRFPPQPAGGIVVIRVPRNPSLGLLENLVKQFLQALGQMSVERCLWVVEVGRIRIHQKDLDEDQAQLKNSNQTWADYLSP